MSWRVIEHEGREYRVAVVRKGKSVWVGWPGGAHRVQSADSGRRVGGGPGHEGDVVAPLTGRVIKVEVEPSQTVEPDQLLVVLEAMKMEYRLTAPKAGTISAVHCAEGDLVDQGTTLVELSE